MASLVCRVISWFTIECRLGVRGAQILGGYPQAGCPPFSCLSLVQVRSRLKATFELSPGLVLNRRRSGFWKKARAQDEILAESRIGDGVAHFRRAGFFVSFYQWIGPKIFDVAASLSRHGDELLDNFDSVGVFEVNQVLALEVWIISVEYKDTSSRKNKEVDGPLLPRSFGSKLLQDS